ncbi:MAG: site-specific integrase [Microgenomates group bacterium]
MTRKTFRKTIVTEELLEKVNPENKKLVDKFLREKSIRASETTINSYRSSANIFFVWNYLNNENKHFTEIKKLEFSDFFFYATEELKWGSARANGLRSLLSSLSVFIEKFMDTEYPNFKNIVLKTIESVPKEFRREKTILSDEQVEDLLKYLSETNSQQACWVALAIYSGSRFAELMRFTTDMLDENNVAFGDLFMETKVKIKTKGRGKEGKQLFKYILKEKFIPYYRKWIEERKTILEKNNLEHNTLFIKDNGEPATSGTIRSWVTTIENYLKTSFYPHCLRHFLVTELSKKNIPPTLIKDLVGWSNLEMVSLYDDSTSKDKVWLELDNLK